MSNDEKFAKTIDDEELDEVAGGTANEILKDFKFMRDLGIDGANLSKKGVKQIKKEFGNYNHASAFANERLWEDVGIEVDYAEGKNKYIVSGSKNKAEISRNDAMIYAMRAKGKYLNLENYI